MDIRKFPTTDDSKHFDALCFKYGIVVDDRLSSAVIDGKVKEVIFDGFCAKGATCEELKFIRDYLEEKF